MARILRVDVLKEYTMHISMLFMYERRQTKIRIINFFLENSTKDMSTI